MPEIKIPRPFLLTVDDVGWWNGSDGSEKNQPFRTGLQRYHVPEDYSALAALGKALEIRIPAGFVLCEWDRGNLLRQLPSATWMGGRWKCPFTNEVYREKAAGILKDAAAYIEPAVHGIGHEFWINGKMERTEFHTSSGRMRQGDEVKKHLEFFFRLMVQNYLDPDMRLFIPPALNHSFGYGDQGFQDIAASFGIRFVTLVYDRTRCKKPPQFGNVGWERGVIALDRGQAPVPWNRIGPAPDFNPEQAILPLHWANILHEDPEKNMDIVTAWVKKIDCRVRKNGLLPARDIAQFVTQFLNRTQSKIQNRGNTVIIDMGWIRKVPDSALLGSAFFSVNLPWKTKFNIFGTQKVPPSSRWEERFIKVGLPESGKIVFQFYQNN